MNRLIKLLHIVKQGFLYPLYKNKVAACVEHIPVLLSLKCQHFIDIGANCGQFALVARKYYPLARIDSFEPLKRPSQCFESLFHKDSNVHLHRFAIGPEKQTLPMHISKRADSSSILPIGSNQSSIFPGTEETHTEHILVAPLNNYLKREDLASQVFVKIDVQGYELEVLKGCKSLMEHFDYIYVECSFIELYESQALADEVIKYLSDHSFKLAGVYNLFYDKKGIAIQADFLFEKNNDNL